MKFGIQPDNSGFVWLHRLLDALTPISLLYIILYSLGIPWHDRYLVMGLLGGFIFVFAAQQIGIYSAWRGRALFSSFKLILSAWFLTWASLIVIAFLAKDAEHFSRLTTLIWAILTPIILITYRILIRSILGQARAKGRNSRNIVIIGAGKVGQNLAETLNTNKWLGYNVVAFIDDNPNLQNQSINHIPIIGSTKQTLSLLKGRNVHEVYLCLPFSSQALIKQLLNELTDTTFIVKFIPDLFSFDLMHAKWTEIKGIPVISVYDTPLNSTSTKTVKRAEDIIIASAILILISPLLAWVAYKVKTTSPGPIIFKQKRYGVNGEEIKVYKFRSMCTQDNGTTIKQATKNDSRITPFGAFIRRTSLDELPQFINVLQGRMSLVGPRPHAVAHNEEYRKIIPKYMQRHIIKPGITGWAQINGWRGETDTIEKMEKRIEFDLHYINTWSLWLDIKIIFLTIFKGFIDKNAY